jgi:hypothetical protein
MADPQAWKFHKNLVDTFGGVTKLYGFWGVSSAGVVESTLVLIARLQHKQLYVCDPKALHHLVVKDQLVYEEATWLL